MKTSKPYLNMAYCPEPGCWFRFIIFFSQGIDENTPIQCPSCGSETSRIEYRGDFNGDQLKEIYKAADKAREEEKRKKDEGEEDDDQTDSKGI